MKICILTTGHPALDNRIFYKEALSLKKKYDDITIIAPDEKKEYMENGIKILGVKKPESLYDRFRLAGEIVNRSIDLKADVYHFHDFEMIYRIMKIKKYLPHSKIVYDVHEHYPDMMSMSKKIPYLAKPFATFFIDKSEISICKKFDYIITADDAVRERLKEYNSNIDIIYNFSEFNPILNEHQDKEYDVIYQGDITLERGVFNAVKSIELIRKEIPNVKMIFVGPFGDVKAREMVYKYIEDNNLGQNIKFTGRIPHKDVEDYMRKSRIGIVTLLPFPKYYKNIPIKQFEYMSCGIPVVGSDLPPIKRFVESFNSGVIVDPTNPNEIADSILKLLKNPELCKELGKNGIRAITEAYNWGKMENKLLNIYEKLES